MKQGTTKNVTDIHGEVLYMENTGILREVHADGYGFKIMDLTVAAMLKAYLQQMVAETAVEQLGRVVSPAVRGLRGGTVKERKLAEKEWNAIDAEELAALIDNARVAAAISAMEWKAQEGEKLLEKAIGYMRDDLFPALDGQKYINSRPVEMAEFLTDCWLTVA